ncbi:hypothetical protein AB0L05_27975 [Nonomuraea pusilla]
MSNLIRLLRHLSPNPPKPPMWTCGCGTKNEDYRSVCRNCQVAR